MNGFMDLHGKTAIVTGAGRGIGRAICILLSRLGASVVVNYSGNGAEADKTLAMCGSAIKFRADVSDEDECRRLFEKCEASFGAPQILVNNAGITRDGLLMRMSSDDFDRVLDVNLKGAFNCVKLASKSMMRARYGRIVNISSVVASSGNAGQINYVASKAGLLGLTRAAAAELAARGITVNSVAPGFIETDMTASLTDGTREAMSARIPQGRFGTPEDVAGAVAFLCSDAAGYITGQTLGVNGGMYM
ncbi:MAG: 3-oxoacyl-[acyl-carrier-protein] reductase [Oscillospiraceae bacterium]|jgi:3-oxoacyl-[acyl-carrier protein] reductase|nr:3-oxoacyl-[acyl-carrier-protein] reductase [Oscillospiraceae bacterium]